MVCNAPAKQGSRPPPPETNLRTMRATASQETDGNEMIRKVGLDTRGSSRNAGTGNGKGSKTYSGLHYYVSEVFEQTRNRSYALHQAILCGSFQDLLRDIAIYHHPNIPWRECCVLSQQLVQDQNSLHEC